jgi:hypothetical protein
MEFAVCITPESLVFGGITASVARYDPAWSRGAFAEGLWRNDVWELFIKEENSQRYVELNLAPSGAWWACLFTSYRIPDSHTSMLIPNVTIEQRMLPHTWQAMMVFPRNGLPIHTDLDGQPTMNACTIQGQPRRFYSHAPPSTEQPDFHAWAR